MQVIAKSIIYKNFMRDQNDVVSVIMATYNRGYCINRAITSIIGQTYSNWELVVVDDSSSDNTEEVVKNLQEKDSRIKYLKLEKNRGCSGARNEGIKICNGDYITFLDSDDEYAPTKIERQLEVFHRSSNENLGIVSCGAIDHRDGIEYNRRMPLPKEDYYLALLGKEKRIGVGSPFMMIKASIIKEEGHYFDADMPAAIDWDIAVRILKKYGLEYVDEYLVYYYHHSNERMYNPTSAIKALNRQYTKYLSWLKEEPTEHVKFVQNAAALRAHYLSIPEGIKFINESLNNFSDNSSKNKLKAFKILLNAFRIKYFKLFYLKYFNKR